MGREVGELARGGAKRMLVYFYMCHASVDKFRGYYKFPDVLNLNIPVP